MTHSPHPNLKVFAAGSIKQFFKDFPELEEDAINAVYDLCEDQAQEASLLWAPFLFNFKLSDPRVGTDSGLLRNRSGIQRAKEMGEEKCRCAGTTTPKWYVAHLTCADYF